jgi:hypothetical protein
VLIYNQGRATPSLPEMTSKNKKCTRKFHDYYYEKYPWLTGCVELNKLFCWSCLLFSKEQTVWSNKGYSDMNNFDHSWKNHQKSQAHKDAMFDYDDFKTSNVYHDLNEQARNANRQHNAKVDKNRSILKTLINAVMYLSSQELAFRGHNEKNDSNNQGNYLELLNFVRKIDPELNEHLNKS